jgi:hypothetical protein
MDAIPIGTLCLINAAPDGSKPDWWGRQCTVIGSLVYERSTRGLEPMQGVALDDGAEDLVWRPLLVPIQPPETIPEEKQEVTA